MDTTVFYHIKVVNIIPSYENGGNITLLYLNSIRSANFVDQSAKPRIEFILPYKRVENMCLFYLLWLLNQP